MALGYADNHRFEIPVYAQHSPMRGRVCINPEEHYGSDWRESPDLQVFSGTASELVAQALATLNRKGVKQHDFICAREVLEYLDVTATTDENEVYIIVD